MPIPRPLLADPRSSRSSPIQALLAAAVAAALTVSLPGQRHFDELRKRHLPADADDTRAVAVGDVDGDGDADIVLGNAGQQNRLYRNDGAEVFTDATAGRMPADADVTRAVALGDVDGDGDLDLVLGNGGSSLGAQNRLYLNDGSGVFRDATATNMPVDSDATAAVALTDVDGDGDLDLVVGNDLAPGQQNRLYVNDGAGVFTDETAARMPADADETAAVATGDVDGDGDVDLVLGSYAYNQQNRLYLNDGHGYFSDATAASMPVQVQFTRAVALGDVDGDGDLDLAVGNGYGYGAQNRLYLNDGTGQFSDVTATSLPFGADDTTSVVLFDVDTDGDLDMLVGNRGQNLLYVNGGSGSGIFAAVTGVLPACDDWTNAVALGAGVGGIVFGNGLGDRSESQNRLLLPGNGTMVDATDDRLPDDAVRTRDVAIGDIDGDGDLDLICGNAALRLSWGPEANRVYRNDGIGAFELDAGLGFALTNAVALGDLDGDGDLDLVAGNSPFYAGPGPFGPIWLGFNRIYLNDGAGSFTASSTPSPGISSTGSVALGDIDGDGDLDMVYGVPGQQNRLYENDGHAGFTDVTATQLPPHMDATSRVVFGDVDGDGDEDMVLANDGQQNRLYVNDGAGVFADETATRLPTLADSTASVALGDIDGDLDLDLLFANPAQQNRLYRNDGSGHFVDVTATHLPAGGSGRAAFGDVDEDGDLDLVLDNGLLLNDGSGLFTDVTLPRMPLGGGTVVLGDVDGDGDLDAVFGNDGQNTLVLNLLRQLDAPYLLRAGRAFALEAYARYGAPSQVDLAFPFVSFARASVPYPALGTIGIDPSQMLALPWFAIPQPAGVGAVTVGIPNLPALAGMRVYAQAVLYSPPNAPRLSNVTGDVLLR